METTLFTILTGGLGILSVVGVIYLGTAFIVAVQIYSFAISRVVKIPKLIVSPKQRNIFAETDRWAEEHGFHYVGLYRIQIVLLAVWENPEKSTFLAQYLNFEGPFFDITTAFDKNISLTTSNIRDGILLPLAWGNYAQHFPKKTLEELWERHLEAERYLTETGAHLTSYRSDIPWGNVRPADPFAEPSGKPEPSAIEIVATGDVRTQAKFVRSLLLWPLRWPYWYFVRRFTWVHKTLQEQVELGRFVLPRDLPPDYEGKIVHWPPKKEWDGFEPLPTASLFPSTQDDDYYIEPEYTRTGVPEPEAVGKIGKTFQWSATILFAVLFGVIPLFYAATNWMGRNAMQRVQRSLAEQDYEKAKQRAVAMRHRFFRPKAIQFVAKEQADAGRYDDALETAKLLERLSERDGVLRFIVAAKVAEGHFDVDDILRRMTHDHYRTESLKDIARTQAKAGRFEGAVETLDKIDDKDAKESATLDYAGTLFELGRFEEALQLVNSIPGSPQMKTSVLGNAATKLATDGNTEQAAQLLRLAVEEIEKIEHPRTRPHFLQMLLPKLRQSGQIEEGLKFVQEIAQKFPQEENLSMGQTALRDNILAETAILYAEREDYEKAWDVALSIPTPLDSSWSSSAPKDRAFLEIVRIERKRNLERLQADGRRIDTLVEELVKNAGDEEEQLDPLMKLFIFQVEAGRFTKAEATVRRRTDMKFQKQRFAVNLHDFQTRLANGLAEAGRIDEAIKNLKGIRDFYAIYAWHSIIKAEAKAGRFDDAVKHLSHCKRQPDCHDEAVADIAKAQLEQGRLAEVEKTLDLFKATPKKVEIAVSLAEAYDDAGNRAEAVAWTDRLAPLMNRYWEAPSWQEPKPELFSRIAILEAKLGRFPEARKAAQRISSSSGDLRTKTLTAIVEKEQKSE